MNISVLTLTNRCDWDSGRLLLSPQRIFSTSIRSWNNLGA